MNTPPTTEQRPDAWQIATARRRDWLRHVLSHPGLTAAQKTVLCALETYTDHRDGSGAFPGETRLAETCSLTTRAVRTALKLAQQLGLIERSAPANSKQGRAATYRLIAVSTDVGHGRNGGAGHEVYDRNGGAGHEVYDRNGGAGHEVYDRNGGAGARPTTGTAVPPTRELLHTHQCVLPNWGTEPETAPPSRFCDLHPHGTRDACGKCANARTAFTAWQADAAARDVELAQAEDHARHRARELAANCPDCHGTNLVDVGDNEVRRCTHQPSPRTRHLVAVGHA